MVKKNSLITQSIEVLSEFPSMIFDKHLERRNPIGVWMWLLIFYLIGLIFWGVFFDWRKSPLSFHDWSAISLPRYDVMRDAINYRMLPLHADCKECLHGVTDRFFVLPDVITTPQMLIMLFVDTDTFGIIDLLLHYTIATVGLIILRNYLKLSLVAYSFLFFLFNFNGYIQSHYAVGHLSWAGYFLFPFYFLLIFLLFDHQPSWKWVAGMSGLSFYIVLAGSQHHFTWLMLFLIFLALSQRSLFKWIVITILFSGFLSAVRLLPPVLGLNDFESFKFVFRTGYHTLYDFWLSLVRINHPDVFTSTFYKYTGLGYWEFNYFISFIGVFFVIYFGVVDWLRGNSELKKYFPLCLPALILFLLSQGDLYKYTLFNFPLFASERVVSRMVSVPLTFFIIIGIAQFQEFLNVNKSKIIRWITIGGLIVLINEIYTHILVWNIGNVGEILGIEKMQFPGNSIINHLDPPYIMVLSIGLILTLISAITLITLVVRESRKNR